jgi:germacradienol/geosmin synthase
MRQFQHVTAAELPVLCDDFELDDAARDAVDGYVGQMRNWLSGILNWHRGCDRYDEAALRRRYGATGAGDAPKFGQLPSFHSARVPC